MDARHDEEEPEAAVIAGACDGGIAAPEDLVEHAAPCAKDQVRPVFVGEQVAAVFVGQHAAGVIDAMQPGDEALQRRAPADLVGAGGLDRKSTRLNSGHLGISYAVFCLK